jgi:ubiquinone/menaquinone biosynthesis C-methylase UbiE
MKNDYDPIAFFYDGLSRLLGEEYQESKFTYLEEIKENVQVLYLGGGTGGNLIHLLQQVGEGGKVYYVEASSKMIERAEKRIPSSLKNRVIFLYQRDFSEIPPIKFDWLIAQYFLDILPLEEIDLLFQALSARSGKDSQWLFVDFFEVHGNKWLINLMIGFFQFFTHNPRKDLPDYSYFFKKYGWEAREKRHFKKGLIQAWVLTKKDEKRKETKISR